MNKEKRYEASIVDKQQSNDKQALRLRKQIAEIERETAMVNLQSSRLNYESQMMKVLDLGSNEQQQQTPIQREPEKEPINFYDADRISELEAQFGTGENAQNQPYFETNEEFQEPLDYGYSTERQQ